MPWTYKNDEHTKLLIQAKNGNNKAFAKLHAALVPHIRKYIASLDGQLSSSDRDDLVQETIFTFWQKLSEYRREASAMTFALIIARNLTLKNIAKRQRSPVVYAGNLSSILGERELCEQSPALSIESTESRKEIQLAMNQLTDMQREAVELSFVHNSRVKAAKTAGCTPTQFTARLCYARKRLRQILRGLV